MRKIIIADTSCLIVLEKIGHLDLLNQVFGEILIT
jgi:predicted nucleic acid-binding protein